MTEIDLKNMIAGMIERANEEQSWLRDIEVTKEINSMAVNGDFSPEWFFLNPKLWDEEAGELTAIGSDEWDRLVRSEALSRVRGFPEITEVGDIENSDPYVKISSLEFFLNAHPNMLFWRETTWGVDRFTVIYDGEIPEGITRWKDGCLSFRIENDFCFSDALKLLCFDVN